MHRFSLATVVIAAALATGCAARVGYSASVEGSAPDLVYAAPGVQVIADYDEPVFYSDNFYWRFDGGTWYRSTTYTGGWAYATPPQAVLRIDQPRQYVHYRPQGWVDHRQERQQGPVVRDHREERHEDNRPAVRDERHEDNRPAVRDERHEDNRPAVRDERHEEKREEKHDDGRPPHPKKDHDHRD